MASQASILLHENAEQLSRSLCEQATTCDSSGATWLHGQRTRRYALIMAIISAAAVTARTGADMYPANPAPGLRRLDANCLQDLWVLRNLQPTGQDDSALLGKLSTMPPTQYCDGTGLEDLYASRPIVDLETDLPGSWRDGLPVRMSAAEWFYRPKRAPPRAAKSSMFNISAPAAIGLGIVTLGLIGWWLRRFT